MKINIFKKHKSAKGQTNDFLEYATVGLIEKDMRIRYRAEFKELEDKCARYIRAKYLTHDSFRKLSIHKITLKPEIDLKERK